MQQPLSTLLDWTEKEGVILPDNGSRMSTAKGVSLSTARGASLRGNVHAHARIVFCETDASDADVAGFHVHDHIQPAPLLCPSSSNIRYSLSIRSFLSIACCYTLLRFSLALSLRLIRALILAEARITLWSAGLIPADRDSDLTEN